MQFIKLLNHSYRQLVYPLFFTAIYLYFFAVAFGENQAESNITGLNNSYPNIIDSSNADLNVTGKERLLTPVIAQRSRLTVSIGHNLSRATKDVGDEAMSNVLNKIQNIVENTSNHLTSIFLHTPKNPVALNILSPEDFFKVTGAPRWTSALYYNGTIFIPLSHSSVAGDSTGSKEDITELYSAIKHEYIHAFLAEFSDNRIPAWLDEGMAQYLEGQDNPRLAPALRNWLARNPPLPLDSLDHGFTTLTTSSVVVAYAESLFITRSLINRYGISKIAKVIKLLGQGESLPQSIKLALNIDKSDVEQDLARQLKAWAVSHKASL